jgi:glucan phosphorylase
MEPLLFLGSHGNSILALRRTMMTLVPQFTTDRMVKEYTRKHYLTR